MFILTNDEVDGLLDMPECVATLEGAYRDFGNRDAVEIPRQDLLVPTERPDAIHAFKTMSGSWPEAGVTALRLNSDIVTWPLVGNRQRRVKVPAAPNDRWVGLVMLFSTRTGTPLCLFPDGVIQKTRVGASSGLAAKYLSREDSRVVGLLGAGWQAGAQLEAMCAVRPIELVKVFSPTVETRERFCAEFNTKVDADIRSVANADEAVAECDILVSATNSLVPTIQPDWLVPGRHITSVRASEIPMDILQRVDRLAVNTRDPVTAWPARGFPEQSPEFRNGDYARPDADGFDWDTVPELKDIVAGHAPGRQSDDEVTCFHNYKGLGLQFAALGSVIYRRASEQEMGLVLDDDLFTEDVHP